MDADTLRGFAAALSLGLMLGLEREWSQREAARQAAGSRTFALLGLAGAVAASLGEWVLAAGLVWVGAILAIGYARSSQADLGTTTEMAALATYLLGALAWSRPGLAITLAVLAAGLLASKRPLHRFAREVISAVEVEDAIKFLMVAAVIFPLLPDRDMGPYGVLNPSRIWLLVVALTGIGWIGYIGVRWFGAQGGLLVTGLAGGFVSASATTASMAGLTRTRPELFTAALAGALVASVSTLIQLGAVMAVANAAMLLRLIAPIAAGSLVLGAEVALLLRGHRRAEVQVQVPTSRPFTLTPALILAAILTAVLLAARWGSEQLGAAGAAIATALAGFADAHAAATAVATMAERGQLDPSVALLAATAALGTNTVTKCGLAIGAGGVRFGLRFSAFILAPAAAFAAGLWMAWPASTP